MKEEIREKEEREALTSLYDLRRSVGRFSSGQELKDHLLGKGYAWVLKTRDFIEDSSEEFGKSRVSGSGSVHGTS